MYLRLNKALKYILDYYETKIKNYLSFLDGLALNSTQNKKIMGDIYWKLTDISIQINDPTKAKIYIKLAKTNYFESKSRIPFPVRILGNELLLQSNSNLELFTLVEDYLSRLTDKTEYQLPIILYQLGQLLIFEDNATNKKWLEIVEKLHNRTYIDIAIKDELQTFIELLNAINFKKKSRMSFKVKSMDILSKIESDKSIFQDLIIINYLDLLIDEIKLYGEEDVIKEFNECLTKLIGIAEVTNNIQLLIKTFFTKLILDIVSDSSITSMDKLDEFQAIIDEYPKFYVKTVFVKEKKDFLEKIKIVKKENIDIEQRKVIETLELNSYIQSALALKRGMG